MGALTQALPSVDHEFSKGAAAEVKKLLRAMVFFINRVTSGEGKKAAFSTVTLLPMERLVEIFCERWRAVYLWRVFEVVRRRLLTAFFASTHSGGALLGLGGLFPSRVGLAHVGCTILSSRSYESEIPQKGELQSIFFPGM